MINKSKIVQMDVINIKSGKLLFEFISMPNKLPSGFCVKVKSGGIILKSGDKVNKLYTWNIDGICNSRSIEFYTNDNTIKIWNIYQVNSKDLNIADYWTNNAGMIVENLGSNSRKYNCSDALGDFNPKDNVFILRW